MFRNGFIFRLIGILLLIGLVTTGGFMAYKAGVAQGIAQSPDVAEAIQQSVENGRPVPPMYSPYGYSFGYRYHHFNPFGAICFSIFFLFLFFGALKMVFFRTMRHAWGHHGHRGHWGKWEDGVSPMFVEWHKRAHGEKPTEEQKKQE